MTIPVRNTVTLIQAPLGVLTRYTKFVNSKLGAQGLLGEGGPLKNDVTIQV